MTPIESQPQAAASLDDTLQVDAEKAARRTLRYKFGRLSNRRIIATLRSAADASAYADRSDAELIERWFAAYDEALRRLRMKRAG